MIRPVTCVCFVLACGSGLYLYQAKHRVQVIEREIEKTVRATDEVRDRIRILHAEWTLQNDPQRLQGLADQLLSLKTVAPGQFTSMAELNNRLPAIRPPEPPPAEPSIAPTPQIEEPPPVAAIAPASPPAPPAPKPAVVAAAPPPRPPEQHKAAPPPPSRPVVAEAAPVRQAAPPPRPVMATAEPVRQVIAPTPAVANTGSALGMARSASAPPPPRPMPVNASPWFNNGGGGG